MGTKVNLGTEPSLVVQFISAALSLLVAFQWDGLSDKNAGAIVAVIVAVGAGINALAVRPIAPVVFTGIVGAFVALLGTYGFHISPEVVAGIDALVITGLGLIFRGQVVPTPHLGLIDHHQPPVNTV